MSNTSEYQSYEFFYILVVYPIQPVEDDLWSSTSDDELFLTINDQGYI